MRSAPREEEAARFVPTQGWDERLIDEVPDGVIIRLDVTPLALVEWR
jgi:hypothetical protein